MKTLFKKPHLFTRMHGSVNKKLDNLIIEKLNTGIRTCVKFEDRGLSTVVFKDGTKINVWIKEGKIWDSSWTFNYTSYWPLERPKKKTIRKLIDAVDKWIDSDREAEMRLMGDKIKKFLLSRSLDFKQFFDPFAIKYKSNRIHIIGYYRTCVVKYKILADGSKQWLDFEIKTNNDNK